MYNKQYPWYYNDNINTLKDFTIYCKKKYLNRIAFAFKEGDKYCTKTYSQFFNDVEIFGAYLLDKNFKNSKIAIIGENSYEWVLSYFSIANSSNVVVPLDKELDINSIRNILIETKTKMLIYSDSYKDYAQIIKEDKLGIELINMKDILINIISSFNKQDSRIEFRNIKTKPNDDIAIIYTSGTTGNSKGVVITHKGICNDTTGAMQIMTMYGTTILNLPLHHTYGFSADVLCPMFWGCKNYINKSLKNLSNDIINEKPNFLLAVPLMVETFYKKIWKNAKDNKKDKLLKVMIKISNFLLLFGIDLRRKLFRSVLEAFGGNIDMIICGGAALDKKYEKGFNDFRNSYCSRLWNNRMFTIYSS